MQKDKSNKQSQYGNQLAELTLQIKNMDLRILELNKDIYESEQVLKKN